MSTIIIFRDNMVIFQTIQEGRVIKTIKGFRSPKRRGIGQIRRRSKASQM